MLGMVQHATRGGWRLFVLAWYTFSMVSFPAPFAATCINPSALNPKAEVCRSFITVREQNPRSHHKGATGRVRTGHQRYWPGIQFPFHCKLGQDVPICSPRKKKASTFPWVANHWRECLTKLKQRLHVLRIWETGTGHSSWGYASHVASEAHDSERQLRWASSWLGRHWLSQVEQQLGFYVVSWATLCPCAQRATD